MLAWFWGTDNGRQKPEIMVMTSLYMESDYRLLRSPSKLVTLNPKLKSTGAGRYQLLSRCGMPTASSLAWKTSLRKVRTLWHCSRLRSVALYLWLIVVISVRQSTVAAISGLHCRALVMVSSEHKADSLIAKFKEAGGTVREIDVWAESLRLSPLWLSASSSACCGLLIITVITPLPIKPSATKCQRTEAGERGNYWHADARQRDAAALDAKYMKELADAKAENDVLCVMMRCRWSSSVAHQSSLSVSAWSHHRLRVEHAASPRLADTAERIISTSERLITMQNNWKEPRSILMSSADRAGRHDAGNSCTIGE